MSSDIGPKLSMLLQVNVFIGCNIGTKSHALYEWYENKKNGKSFDVSKYILKQEIKKYTNSSTDPGFVV
jgi:hypothetical protein